MQLNLLMGTFPKDDDNKKKVKQDPHFTINEDNSYFIHCCLLLFLISGNDNVIIDDINILDKLIESMNEEVSYIKKNYVEKMYDEKVYNNIFQRYTIAYLMYAIPKKYIKDNIFNHEKVEKYLSFFNDNKGKCNWVKYIMDGDLLNIVHVIHNMVNMHKYKSTHIHIDYSDEYSTISQEINSYFTSMKGTSQWYENGKFNFVKLQNIGKRVYNGYYDLQKNDTFWVNDANLYLTQMMMCISIYKYIVKNFTDNSGNIDKAKIDLFINKHTDAVNEYLSENKKQKEIAATTTSVSKQSFFSWLSKLFGFSGGGVKREKKTKHKHSKTKKNIYRRSKTKSNIKRKI